LRELKPLNYKIFAALQEETTSGWVWLAKPEFVPHRIIYIRNKQTHKKIYCECRVLDENFRQVYNDRPRTKELAHADVSHALVIGDWYRAALGIPETGIEVELTIDQPWLSAWPSIKAGTQHPDPNVRLANRLGILGTWLGIVGIVFSIDKLKPYATGMVALLALLALWTSKGIRR
jgi:hypothetical protein